VTRKTVIRHPDGTVTEVTSSGSLGRGCSAVGWACLVLIVLVGPAAWWGAWSVFAYFGLALAVVALVVKHRAR
jgi:hypothetical protein